jgi:hypothetical protein
MEIKFVYFNPIIRIPFYFSPIIRNEYFFGIPIIHLPVRLHCTMINMAFYSRVNAKKCETDVARLVENE